MEHLFFPVEKVPIKDLGISIPAPSGQDFAIVSRGKREQILTFCSEDYGLTRNEEIYKVFQEVLLDNGLDFDFTGTAHNQSVFKMEFTLKSNVDRIQGDPVAPRLWVYNSYNRRVKFQFGVSVMRLVCTNGLTTWVDDLKMKALHTSGIEGGLGAERCLPMIKTLLDDWGLIMEPFEDLSTAKVPNIEARIDEIVGETGFPNYLRDVAFKRVIQEMDILQLKSATDWIIYNGLNYALVHEDSLIGRKSDALDLEVLNYMLA